MSVLIADWGVGSCVRHHSNTPLLANVSTPNFPIRAYAFETGQWRNLYGFAAMPKSGIYTAGADLEARFSWLTDGKSVGVVRWIMSYLGRKDGETWDVAFSASPNDYFCRTASNQLRVSSFEITSPSLEPGDDLVVSIGRGGAAAADTYEGWAFLTRVRLYVR